jgi:hypothetical protein
LGEERVSVFFRIIGYFSLSKLIIKEIFLMDIITKVDQSWDSTEDLDRIVELLLPQSRRSEFGTIFIEIFTSSLMARCWNLTAALIGPPLVLTDLRYHVRAIESIIHALRCLGCQDLNRVNGRQSIPPTVWCIYKLCAVHVGKLEGVGELDDICHPADYLLKNESLWFIPGKFARESHRLEGFQSSAE